MEPNQPPSIIDYKIQSEKGEISISVTPSLSRNFIIELNKDNDEIEYSITEFNLHELG